MIKNLMQRRVPQIVGLYLGGAWVVVEFMSFLTERYLLSDKVTDLVLVTLLAMLPTVIVMAWFHGTPGKDKWVTAEKIVIPTNVIVTLALLFMLFRGAELGATTTTITTTDEQGVTVTRVAPKQSFRKNIGLFHFDNTSGDPALDWMRYGVSMLLRRDLEQNPFIDVWSPLDGFEQSNLIDLQRAGFGDALDVPVSLMRDIARKHNLPLIVTGSFSRIGDELAIEASLYETGQGSQPKRLRAVAGNLPEAVDKLTLLIKETLNLPAGADALAPDLPVAEHFSASPLAIEKFVEGTLAGTIDNDFSRALDLLREAAEVDRSFAAANVSRAVIALNSGQTDAASAALASAGQHDYRLLSEEKFVTKALNYYLSDQVEKMLSVYAMHSELYPDDIDSLRRLAFAYLYQANDVGKSLETLQTIRDRDPNAQWPLTIIAELKLVQGDIEGAREMLIEYSQARPEDYLPLVSLAQIHAQAGELDTARGYLERSVLLATGRVDPILYLATLELREGRYPEALARIEEARAVAKIPRQESRVIETELEYFLQRGMTDKLADRLDALFEVDTSYRGIINLMMTTVSDHVSEYVLAGQTELYLTRLDEIAAKLEPPLNELEHVGLLGLYLETGDIEKSEYHADIVRTLTERFGRDDLGYLNELAVARIMELKGDLPAAIAAAESSLAKFGQSVHSVETEGDRIRIRNMLAELHRRNGDPVAAQAVLGKVLETFPAQPVTHLILAAIAQDNRDPSMAREHLAVSLGAWEPAPDDYHYKEIAMTLASSLANPSTGAL